MRDLHWNQIGNLFLSSSVTDLLLPPLVILILIKEGVVVFAFRYILRSITLVGELIEHEAELAALLSGGDAVEADVEVGAVVGVSVLGVGVKLAELISGST